MPENTAHFPPPAGCCRCPGRCRTIASTVTWDETEGPAVENVGPAGFGTKLLQSALRAFDGKTEISFLKTGVHCTMQCRIPAS